MEVAINDVMNELRQIRIEISAIKQNLVDSYSVLTAGEERKINDVLGEYERGETTSLKSVEKGIFFDDKNCVLAKDALERAKVKWQ